MVLVSQGLKEFTMYRERIKLIYGHLSPSYRKVADFLLDSYREAAFMNASGLAQHLDVDPATVVRFSQRLGYPGYPELAEEVRGIVRDELITGSTPSASGNGASVLHNSLKQDSQNLDEFLVRNPTALLDQVTNALSGAPRVLAVSEGIGGHLVAFFVDQLRQIGRPAEVIPLDAAQSSQVLAGVVPGEVVLGLGLSHYATDVAAILGVANELGAETIGLVESLTSPVAMTAKTVLQIPQKAVGPLASLTTILSFLSATVQNVCLKNQSECSDQVAGSSTTYSGLVNKRKALIGGMADDAVRGADA
jgi:DNA-binding MurR/RpiR family transcriptional regulator